MKSRPSSIPLYSLADVSRYARAQLQLVRRLYLGYKDGDVVRPPMLASSTTDARAPLSFDDLIETAVISGLRGRGIRCRRFAKRIGSLPPKLVNTLSPDTTSSLRAKTSS